MKNVILQRPIVVEAWNVLGTVARSSKRPELIPVLLRAREQSQTSADDVAEHLFFEQRSRRVVADRLLRIASNYGLLAQKERCFTLTEAGHAALDSEQVFVPERGSWTVWTSSDPLLAHPVLRIDPWSEPTAYDELRGKERDSAQREFVAVPSALRGAIGRIVAPPCGGGGSLLRIDELDGKGEIVQPESTLRLIWNVGEDKMRLEGTLRGAGVNTVIDAPRLASDFVWQQLLESAALWSRWDPERNALLVTFDETEEGERESLTRDLVIPTPSVAGFGEFDKLTIQDVPLHPRSTADAGLWSAWRLQERLRDYATSARFRGWCQEATAPFADHRLAVPSRADLANQVWSRREVTPFDVVWHLIAAEDWSL